MQKNPILQCKKIILRVGIKGAGGGGRRAAAAAAAKLRLLIRAQ